MQPMPARFVPALALLALLITGAVSLRAQEVLGAAPNNPATKFKDTSILVPPAGSKVAVLEWEDLECPYCARVFPAVHVDVKAANIPLVERDYLIPGHVWSHEAALVARYLHDKVSPAVSTQYRRELFASQFRIASREDLQHFDDAFFKTLSKPLPTPIDPTGALEKEVAADVALGDQLGVAHTPTIVVVSPHHYTEVLDVEELPKAIANEKQRADATPSATKIPTPHPPRTGPVHP